MIIRFLGYLFSAGIALLLIGVAAAIGAFFYYSEDLPPTSELADYKPPQSSLVMNDDGGVIARFAREERVFVPIDTVPELVKNAFISAEDKNFYNHSGIDPFGIAKAMVRNVSAYMNGRRMSGASTITQQVVKNTLLTNERSVKRKIREAILAMQIEDDLEKDRILELYLNQIYLGARSYGIGAASRAYFDKPLEYLTVEEAAYLAALPKAPSALHPVRNRDAATARRNYVLNEMAENGYIEEGVALRARATPLKTFLGKTTEQRTTGPSYDWSSAYMIEEVRAKLLEWQANDSDALDEDGRVADAEAALYGDGLRIRTTLDAEMQSYAGAALRHGLHAYTKRSGYHGPLGKIEPDEKWREKLAEQYFPRDLGDWKLAIVLEIDEADENALVGVEGLDKPVEITLDAVRWAHEPIALTYDEDEQRPTAPDVEKISQVLTAGDVIYVTSGEEIADGDIVIKPVGERNNSAKPVWGLRQLPKANGAVVAMEVQTGRVLAMQGGISAQQSVFNRVTQAKRQPGSSFKPIVYAAALDNGYTPATIVLDAPVTVDQGNDEGLWKPSNYDEGRFYGPTPFRVGVEKSKNLMTVRIAQDIGMETISEYAKMLGVYDDMPRLLSYSLGAGETTLMRMSSAYATFMNGGVPVIPRLIETIENAEGDPVELDVPWVVTEAEEDTVPIIDPVTAYQVVSIMEGVVKRGTATRLTLLGFPVAGKTGTTNEARDAWFVGFTPEIVFGCYIGFDNPKSLGNKASGGALCGPVFDRFMREAMLDRTPLEFTPPPGVELVKINRFTGERVGDDIFGSDVIWEAFRSGTEPAMPIGSSAQSSSKTVGQGGWATSGDFDWANGEAQTQPAPAQAANNVSVDIYGTGQGGNVNRPLRPSAPIRQVSAPAPSGPEEPLIRFDPATGNMIVASDPAISVEGGDGIIFAPVRAGSPAAAPMVDQPIQQPGALNDATGDLQGGRGLY